MIDIVLDAHRDDESPIILIGELPGMIANLEVSVVSTLQLVDDRPEIGVTLKANGKPLPYDYYFGLTKSTHFMSWSKHISRLMQQSKVVAPLNVTLPATSSAGMELEVTVMRGTLPKIIRIFTYPSREVGVLGKDFDLWCDEFVRILDLSTAISKYVTTLREEQREALLNHIDALLVRSAL